MDTPNLTTLAISLIFVMVMKIPELGSDHQHSRFVPYTVSKIDVRKYLIVKTNEKLESPGQNQIAVYGVVSYSDLTLQRGKRLGT